MQEYEKDIAEIFSHAFFKRYKFLIERTKLVAFLLTLKTNTIYIKTTCYIKVYLYIQYFIQEVLRTLSGWIFEKRLWSCIFD